MQKGKKNWKEAAAAALVIVFAVLSFGSGTMEGSATDGMPNDGINRGVPSWAKSWYLETVKDLPHGEVAFVNNEPIMPPAGKADRFGQVMMFQSFINTFDLYDNMTSEQRQELFAALFEPTPKTAPGASYRTVLVDIIPNGSIPLCITVGAATAPKGGAYSLPANTIAQIFQANYTVLTLRDKGSSETRHSFLPGRGDRSWERMAVIYPSGKYVPTNNLSSDKAVAEIKKNAAGDEDILSLNLADEYIKDQFPENDAEAFAMLEKLMAKNDVPVGGAILARLNYALCALSIGDTDKAEAMQEEARSLLPENKDPNITRAIEVELPEMIALYKMKI